jgi:acyl carrier protein
VEPQIISERIKKFLVQQFPATRNVGNEDPLLKNGLIDSLGILEVVTFLEREFSIVVSDEELLPENFESIRSLSKFVRQKTNGTDTAEGSAQGAIETK